MAQELKAETANPLGLDELRAVQMLVARCDDLNVVNQDFQPGELNKLIDTAMMGKGKPLAERLAALAAELPATFMLHSSDGRQLADLGNLLRETLTTLSEQQKLIGEAAASMEDLLKNTLYGPTGNDLLKRFKAAATPPAAEDAVSDDEDLPTP